MSYYFDAAFKECNSFDEALKISYEFCDYVKNNLVDSMIKSHSARIPSNWRSFDRKKHKLDECFSWWDRNWLCYLFNFRFIFWEKQKLLAIIGFDDEAGGLFPLVQSFQDGSDQDYEFDEWLLGDIPYFKQAVNTFENYSAEQLEKIYNEIRGSDDWDLDDIEYQRKSLLHSYIFNGLELDKILWGKSGNFKEFSMSPITNDEIISDFYEILKKYKDD